jgi:hypothetical protein
VSEVLGLRIKDIGRQKTIFMAEVVDAAHDDKYWILWVGLYGRIQGPRNCILVLDNELKKNKSHE